MDEGAGASEGGAEGQAALRLCNLVAQSPRNAEGGFQAGGGERTDGKGRGTVRTDLLQGLQEPGPSDRAGDRDRRPDAWLRQVPRLLPGDDLCRFLGRCESRGRRSWHSAAVYDEILQIPASPR